MVKKVFSNEDCNSGDGMLTSVWGPPMWHTLHTISFNYPVKPTKEQKELQAAEDQKELDSVLGKDEEKPKVSKLSQNADRARELLGIEKSEDVTESQKKKDIDDCYKQNLSKNSNTLSFTNQSSQSTITIISQKETPPYLIPLYIFLRAYAFSVLTSNLNLSSLIIDKYF